jgi:hypothetical protein
MSSKIETKAWKKLKTIFFATLSKSTAYPQFIFKVEVAEICDFFVINFISSVVKDIEKT